MVAHLSAYNLGLAPPSHTALDSGMGTKSRQPASLLELGPSSQKHGHGAEGWRPASFMGQSQTRVTQQHALQMRPPVLKG